jgi:hypothetical protein
MGHKCSGAVYLVAAIFNSEYEDSPPGHSALFFRGGGGRKKARLDAVRVLGVRVLIVTAEKNLRSANGASLRTELIEQDLGVFQIGGIEALGKPAVDVG